MTPRQASLCVDTAAVLVTLSVAVAAAGLTWRLAGDPGGSPVPVAAAGHTPAAPTDIAPILAFAPFGVPTADTAPPTSLPLVLHGIALASSSGRSSAVIAAGGGKPAVMAVGDSVAGARISVIAVDHVLLEAGGRTESLGFPNRTPPAGSVVISAPASPPPSPAALQPLASSRVTLPAPPSLSEALGARRTDAGLRIGEELPAATRKAGLMPGDLIERIDGQIPGDPARDRIILAAAAHAGQARVEILRGGRRFTLTLPLR